MNSTSMPLTTSIFLPNGDVLNRESASAASSSV